ncbi:TPA: FkbM family methyltransferase [Candidatus Poribacteria bacterium]|nr:FkbM family methyltransferase [Candidatus Poribacteria bacterium]
MDTFLTEEKVERIDLINMDCEGSELLVFKGAEKTLKELGFQVYGVSLDDLSLKEEINKPEYIYMLTTN